MSLLTARCVKCGAGVTTYFFVRSSSKSYEVIIRMFMYGHCPACIFCIFLLFPNIVSQQCLKPYKRRKNKYLNILLFVLLFFYLFSFVFFYYLFYHLRRLSNVYHLLFIRITVVCVHSISLWPKKRLAYNTVYYCPILY